MDISYVFAKILGIGKIRLCVEELSEGTIRGITLFILKKDTETTFRVFCDIKMSFVWRDLIETLSLAEAYLLRASGDGMESVTSVQEEIERKLGAMVPIRLNLENLLDCLPGIGYTFEGFSGYGEIGEDTTIVLMAKKK